MYKQKAESRWKISRQLPCPVTPGTQHLSRSQMAFCPPLKNPSEATGRKSVEPQPDISVTSQEAPDALLTLELVTTTIP